MAETKVGEVLGHRPQVASSPAAHKLAQHFLSKFRPHLSAGVMQLSETLKVDSDLLLVSPALVALSEELSKAFKQPDPPLTSAEAEDHSFREKAETLKI